MGWRSTGTVRDLLAVLERKGHITRPGHRSRSIALRESPSESVEVPLVGRIAAGRPVASEELEGETVAIPHGLVDGDCFALRVSGESMIGAGILSGDLVVVRQQPTAKTGQIIAATIDGDTTLKMMVLDDKGARLEAANPSFAPIPLRGDSAIAVHGVVIGLLRKYDGKRPAHDHS